MELLDFIGKLLSISQDSQLPTVICIGIIAIILHLVKHLMVPAVERFSADQRRESEVADVFERQLELLLKEKENLLNSVRKRDDVITANRDKMASQQCKINALALSHDRACDVIERFRELSFDDSLSGDAVIALRELCRDCMTIKSSRDILNNY